MKLLSIIEKILYLLAIISYAIPTIFGIITIIVGIYVGYISDQVDAEMGIIEDTPGIIKGLLGSLIICICNLPFWIIISGAFIAIGLIIHRKLINKPN